VQASFCEQLRTSSKGSRTRSGIQHSRTKLQRVRVAHRCNCWPKVLHSMKRSKGVGSRASKAGRCEGRCGVVYVTPIASLL